MEANANAGENNFTAVTGALVMTKAWDLSPVDPWAFDPTQPPGPVARPVQNRTGPG